MCWHASWGHETSEFRRHASAAGSGTSEQRTSREADLDMRVADADRERVIAELREHCSDGRLSLDEFGDRIDEVYAAKTFRDLQAVLRGLPARPLVAVEHRRPRPRRPALAVVAAVVLLIWALSFWPMWILAWVAFALFKHGGFGRRFDHRRRHTITV